MANATAAATVLREADLEDDAPATSGEHRRPSMMNRFAGQARLQPNMLLMIMLLGGGGLGAAGTGAVFGSSDTKIEQLRRDVDAAAKIASEAKTEVGAVTKAQLETQNELLQKQVDAANEAVRVAYWGGDNVRVLSTAIELIAAKIGVEVNTKLTPYTRARQ